MKTWNLDLPFLTHKAILRHLTKGKLVNQHCIFLTVHMRFIGPLAWVSDVDEPAFLPEFGLEVMVGS